MNDFGDACRNGNTHLDIAVTRNNIKAIQFLRDEGTRVHIVKNDDSKEIFCEQQIIEIYGLLGHISKEILIFKKQRMLLEIQLFI